MLEFLVEVVEAGDTYVCRLVHSVVEVEGFLRGYRAEEEERFLSADSGFEDLFSLAGYPIVSFVWRGDVSGLLQSEKVHHA